MRNEVNWYSGLKGGWGKRDDRATCCENIKLWLWGLFFMCRQERSPRCYVHRGPESPSPVAVEIYINSDVQVRSDPPQKKHCHNRGVCFHSCWHAPRRSLNLEMGIRYMHGHTWKETCLLRRHTHTNTHTSSLALSVSIFSVVSGEDKPGILVLSVRRTPITSGW